ncbi:hypothetical protein WME76_21800 [Sorangium sp. So ce119]|uniref:hypothetical protein n=1 Tax=Sorangium sp. So ce119 TaxID=3133279 RepID=UPI003F643A8E
MGHRLWLLVSRYHLDPGMSSVLVDAVATAGLLVLAAIALRLSRRQRRAAARADASLKGDAALAPGEAIVVGTVERAPGADVAVRVEVEQEGTESESSGVWSHQWVETGRKVRVHPFYLRHASGALVRVEPGEDVMLVDALDGMIRVDLTRRIRVAEIMPGEKVFALGELRRAPDPEAPAQGYREKALGDVLVPRRGQPMLVSSEPLDQRFARRAAFHRRWAVAAVVASLAFNAAFAGFHARRWLGETVDVRVTQLREQEDRDGDNTRFVVTMQAADGVLFSDEVPHATFGRLRGVERLKARYVPSWTAASAVGPDVTAHSAAYVALPLLGAIALAYAVRARSTIPWYEKKLSERGSGRLPGSTSAPRRAAKRPEGRRQKPASG